MSARKEREKDRDRVRTPPAPSATTAPGGSVPSPANVAASPGTNTVDGDANSPVSAATVAILPLNDDYWRCLICAAIPLLSPADCDAAYLVSFADTIQSGSRAHFICITSNTVLEWALDNVKSYEACRQAKSLIDASPRGTPLPDAVLAKLIYLKLLAVRVDMIETKKRREITEENTNDEVSGGIGGKDGTVVSGGGAGGIKSKERKDSPLKRGDDEKKKKTVVTNGAKDASAVPTTDAATDEKNQRKKDKLRDRAVAKPKAQAIDDEPTDGPDTYIIFWGFRSSKFYQHLINDYNVPVHCFMGMDHIKPLIPSTTSTNSAVFTAPTSHPGSAQTATRVKDTTTYSLPWRIFSTHPILDDLESIAARATSDSPWNQSVFTLIDCDQATDITQLFDICARRLYDIVEQQKRCAAYYSHCIQLLIPGISTANTVTGTVESDHTLEVYDKIMAVVSETSVSVELMLSALVEEVVYQVAPAESMFSSNLSTFSELSCLLDKTLFTNNGTSSTDTGGLSSSYTAGINTPASAQTPDFSHPSIDIYYHYDAAAQIIPQATTAHLPSPRIQPLSIVRKMQDLSRVNLLLAYLHKLGATTGSSVDYREDRFRTLLSKSDLTPDVYESMALQLHIEEPAKLIESAACIPLSDWRWVEELDRLSLIGAIETHINDWLCPHVTLDINAHGALLLIRSQDDKNTRVVQHDFQECYEIPAKLGFGLFYQISQGQHDRELQSTNEIPVSLPIINDFGSTPYVYDMEKQIISYRRDRQLLVSPDGAQVLFSRIISNHSDSCISSTYINVCLGDTLITMHNERGRSVIELLIRGCNSIDRANDLVSTFTLSTVNDGSIAPQLGWAPTQEYVCWFTDSGDVIVANTAASSRKHGWDHRRITTEGVIIYSYENSDFSIRYPDGNYASRKADGTWLKVAPDGQRSSFTWNSKSDSAMAATAASTNTEAVRIAKEETPLLFYRETDPQTLSSSVTREDGVTLVKRHNGSTCIRHPDGVIVVQDPNSESQYVSVRLPGVGQFSFSARKSGTYENTAKKRVTSVWANGEYSVRLLDDGRVSLKMGKRFLAEASPTLNEVVVSVFEKNGVVASTYTVSGRGLSIRYADRLRNQYTINLSGRVSDVSHDSHNGLSKLSSTIDTIVKPGTCLPRLLSVDIPFSILCAPLPVFVWMRKDGTGKLLLSDMHMRQFFVHCKLDETMDMQILEEPNQPSDKSILVNCMRRVKSSAYNHKKQITYRQIIRYPVMSSDLRNNITSLVRLRETALDKTSTDSTPAMPPIEDQAATTAVNAKIMEIAGVLEPRPKLSTEAILEHFMPNVEKQVLQVFPQKLHQQKNTRHESRNVYADPCLDLIGNLIQRPKKLADTECTPDKFLQVRVELRDQFRNFSPSIPHYFESDEGRSTLEHLQKDQEIFIAVLRESRKKQELQRAQDVEKAAAKAAETTTLDTISNSLENDQLRNIKSKTSDSPTVPLPKERKDYSNPRSNKSMYLRMRAAAKQREASHIVMEAPVITGTQRSTSKIGKQTLQVESSLEPSLILDDTTGDKLPVGLQQL